MYKEREEERKRELIIDYIVILLHTSLQYKGPYL